MKTLIINGSPRGNGSSSFKVAKAFTDGIDAVSGEKTEIIHLSQANVKPCKGCLCCWKGDTGECVVKDDDVKGIHEKLLSAEIVVFSFPLYYFAMPALLSNFFDRSVCLAHSYRGTNGNSETGGFLHEWRYEQIYRQKCVFVSTCGYEFANENYDSVRRRLDLIYGEGRHTDIFVGQGGAIAEKTIKDYVDKFLLKFTEAGKEFAVNASLSEETKALLSKPLLRHNTFVRALNMTWDSNVGPYGNKEKKS